MISLHLKSFDVLLLRNHIRFFNPCVLSYPLFLVKKVRYRKLPTLYPCFVFTSFRYDWDDVGLLTLTQIPRVTSIFVIDV